MEEKFLHAEEPGAEKSSPFRTNKDLNRGSQSDAFELARLKGKFTLCSAERLKSKKIIQQLFDEGKSVSQSGFALIYFPLQLQTIYPAQAGFSVPKKKFKRAVDRNRIKRLMREAYRLNKFELYQKLSAVNKQLALMWVYKGAVIPDYKTVEEAMSGCIKKMKL
jgi:ribonuclease P protein component